jgi:predicted CXXCH cytochrome family protein
MAQQLLLDRSLLDNVNRYVAVHKKTKGAAFFWSVVLTTTANTINRKEKTMKKILAATAVLSLFATSAFAIGHIRNTKHDLSASGGQTVHSSTTQICAFCHTPHNPRVARPLWNRGDVTGMGLPAFKFYTSNQMSDAGVHANLDPSSISAMCMSCHAETYTNANVTAGGPINNLTQNTDIYTINNTVTGKMGQHTALGTDLTKSHPFGFSYTDAQVQRGAGNINGRATTGTPLYAATNGQVGSGATALPLYGATQRIECSSCHKTHDDSLGAFLRVDNANSALCRTCHQN